MSEQQNGQPTAEEIVTEAIKKMMEAKKDKRPLTPLEYNKGLTSLKVMIAQEMGTLALIDFMIAQIQNFPNSEEKLILTQKLSKEHIDRLARAQSATNLLHKYPMLSKVAPGTVREIIRQAEAETKQEFIEDHEQTRQAVIG